MGSDEDCAGTGDGLSKGIIRRCLNSSQLVTTGHISTTLHLIFQGKLGNEDVRPWHAGKYLTTKSVYA